jgi:NitT/TauT family transport system substrate-binding protein
LSDSRKLILGVGVWVLCITALHLWLNFNWSVLLNDRLPENQRRMYVAYIPVT